MDQMEPGCVEFLDLSGVEDQERSWILSSLHSRNPNIQLPWAEDGAPQQAQGYQPLHIANVKCQKQVVGGYHAPPPNGNAHPAPPMYTQIPAYIHQDRPVSMYVQGIAYVPTVTAAFVIRGSPNCENLNTYTNSEVALTQGFRSQLHVPNDLIVVNNYNAPVLDPVQHQQEEVHIEIEQNGMGPPDDYPDEPSEEDTAPQPEVMEAPPPAKSWASLFSKSTSLEPAQEATQQNNAASLPVALVPPFVSSAADVKRASPDVTLLLKEPFKSNADDPNLHRMGEYLSLHTVDNRIISLQPRGLINRSNYCYINSILQAVLACPPVYNLLSGLAENASPSTEKKKITPMIDSMTKFVREFHHLPAGMRVGRRLDKNQKKEHSVLINCDTPFEPFWIHKLLSGVRSDMFVVEGRQEDAEEFLGCLLNGLNDEMLELIKLVSGHRVQDNIMQERVSVQEEDREWQVMGPKNKGSITRRTEFSRTPISDIFGGLLRSRLIRAGDQSTDNIQPFFTLQLNIEKTSTVKEALEILTCKNQLEGVTSSKTNEEVEAWQQVTLEELPIVLVLHLKCFDYKLDGCSKIIKALEFPIDLKIDMKLLSSKTNYSPKERQYKLFAVVYHEGKDATKGHYVTDAYHVGYASWLRYDDASVKAVPEEHVLKPHGTRVPYLLFYRRSDALTKNK